MKKSIVAKIVAASTLVVGSSAFAAEGDTTAASAAFDSLKTQVTEMSGYAWTLVVLVVGSTVGIKLFKKFVNRAS